METSNYDIPLQALKHNCRNLRVAKALAKEWLLMNEFVEFRGNIHHFQIKDLGLGVCAVQLLPKRFVNTVMVKELCQDKFLD